MDFFASQEAAHRKTRVLLAYYALAVISIVCAFYLASRAIACVAWGTAVPDVRESFARADIRDSFRIFGWSPLWMLWTAGLSLAVIVCGTLYRRVSLAEGGASVARSAGGREVNPDTADADERRLLNVVEEMALASGVPVPRVFVLEDEPGINAFAAGFTARDAAVAVTRGTLKRLRRDELQGVVAHEFSHILNGDMRLNSWLIGVLFGILVTSVLGRTLMESLRFVRLSGNRKGSGGGIVVLLFLSGAALWLIGSVGVFFARLIQCSVSRQREYLADASAVQFTRNPMGLAGALKRIGAPCQRNSMRCSNRDELSHLLFASAAASGFDGLFASHPPLLERIHRLDPSFDGDFKPWVSSVPEPAFPARGDGGYGPSQDRSAFAEETPCPASEMGGAAAFLRQLTPEWRLSLAQPLEASGVLYALLLSEDDGVRRRQSARIAEREGMAMVAAAGRWRDSLKKKDRRSRRMFAELAVAGCRRRDPVARATCIGLVKELTEADGSISLFEYMLQNHAVRGLRPSVSLDAFRKPLPPGQVRAEVATVLGALAYAGQPTDDAEAESAWRAGIARATSFGAERFLPDRASCTLDALNTALKRLNGLAPLLKGELLTACAFVVRADGALTPDESELLLAVADALDMPLPQAMESGQ